MPEAQGEVGKIVDSDTGQALRRLGREIVLRWAGDGANLEPGSQCGKGNPRAAARRQQDQGVDCVDVLLLQFQHRLFNLGLS